MKCFLILAAATALVSADIGYQYKVPHTSYGVPSYQHGSSGNQGSQYSGHNALSSGNNYQLGYDTSGTARTQFQANSGNLNAGGLRVGAGSGYQTGNADYLHSGSNLGFQSGSSSTLQSGGNTGFQSTGFYQPAVQAVNYQSNNQYQSLEKSSALSSYQQYYQQVQQQPAQVFKHFYVHAAPEEPEAPKFRQPLVLPPPQKHYKIIFIKTPAPPAPAAPIVPLQQQNEEKTIVYVLVKKPEEAGEVIVPKVAPTPPSKPEVFFIKYNSKEGGSQGVINNIVSDFNAHSGVSSFGGQSSGSGATFNDGVQLNSGTGSSNLLSGGSSSGGSYSTSSQSGSGSVGGLGLTGLSSGSYQTVSSTSDRSLDHGSDLVQGGYSSGQSQSIEGYQSVDSNQGLPHTSYGPPNFRS